MQPMRLDTFETLQQRTEPSNSIVHRVSRPGIVLILLDPRICFRSAIFAYPDDDMRAASLRRCRPDPSPPSSLLTAAAAVPLADRRGRIGAPVGRHGRHRRRLCPNAVPELPRGTVILPRRRTELNGGAASGFASVELTSAGTPCRYRT